MTDEEKKQIEEINNRLKNIEIMLYKTYQNSEFPKRNNIQIGLITGIMARLMIDTIYFKMGIIKRY